MIDITSLITGLTSYINAISGNNEFIAAAIFTAIIFFIRGVYPSIKYMIKRRLFYNVTVSENDAVEMYQAMAKWMYDNEPFITSNSSKVKDANITDKDILLAGNGNTIYLNKQFGLTWFHIVTEKKDTTNFQILYISGFVWNKHRLDKFIRTVSTEDVTLPIILGIPQHNFDPFTNLGRIPRYYSTQQQYISRKVYAETMAIVNRFVHDDEYYSERARKETFLLYGPPGTGKTNLFRHISSTFNLPIIKVAPHEIRTLIAKKQTLAGKWILLLEEIETSPITYKPIPMDPDSNQEIPKHHQFRTGGNDGTMCTDFLNYLDGVVPLNDVLIFMSSNNIDLLNTAIYRPGRVDHLIEIDYLSIIDYIDEVSVSEVRDVLLTLTDKTFPTASAIKAIQSTSIEDVHKAISERDNFYALLNQ